MHRSAVLLVAALAACQPQPQATSAATVHDLVVHAATGQLQAPDSVPAGWVRIKLVAPRPGDHNVVVFRLAAGLSAEAFSKAMDTAAATIASATALGGPEMPPPESDTATMLLHLQPGRYLLGCVLTDSLHHRHLIHGETRWISVTGPPTTDSAAIQPTTTIQLVDFAIGSDSVLPAGPHRIALVNGGHQDHHFMAERLRPGKTMKDWFASTDTAGVSQSLGGATRISPGQREVWEVTLTPGTYVLFCLVPERISRKVHAELGMVRQIRVVDVP